jgi:hypothetical protein
MKTEKTDYSEQDVARLVALRKFERPDARRTEKNIQTIMRTVRTTNNVPTLLFFPDKSFAWMFAQPRYGIAALFVLFLGMNMLNRPPAGLAAGTGSPIHGPRPEIVMSVDTNRLSSPPVPGIAPAYSVVGEPEPFTAYLK